ncbi:MULTISPECIES: phospho-N-acetylmuramoyl-pentapeptide-transferase [Jutongia]|jgi:phospho-N-acetylmuramoyl-pentapeptide-transferase|uniref:Phospho-N-acetylmuramoyl-pentapeptide-transferase n=1 Tax=Jutongia huaianensis TaxID=2763668 RepID=A0ABR7N3N7_9FIRM|nr:phospho-N-acetylmuramoyl-pentapeptide-transferase [Jutongia huaianensis]MBC8562970.1 phospho-N-acetylmuramoyl-pentapeptide-transferase [Jutongia huaianensis]MBS4816159.1 phospho-N-acetylmuramoyl-pentapeptide-transferase [Clostridium sp.]RHU93501.1 phospho-N-acetylmuramoyl-pentapeptide-transferase [Clostridium sp. OM07-9AC]RHV03407.1 phospho-N-acetylmuramoyl-pentapeptide-transferase [Clostridium sp. OM07-10AC]
MDYFDTVIPVLLSFSISIILCPVVIPFLKRLKFGQYVREDGPRSHLKKAGTPTMGGLIILISVAVTSSLYLRDYPEILPILFSTVGFGLIGFLDDYIKVVMRRSLGLRAWQKLVLQFGVTVIFAYYYTEQLHYEMQMLIPFTGGIATGRYISLPIGLFLPFLFFVMVGTVNGTNFTDGLDGLASSVTLLVAVFFTVVAIGTGSTAAPVCAAVAGALMGFLVFNVYPASVFMGDTGSLALGGFVASTALLLKMPLYILIVGAIYLIEVLSVILQVGYFKITHGKRIFKMAPIHHHFEQSGWSETKVVAVFSIVTALFCLIALAAL